MLNRYRGKNRMLKYGLVNFTFQITIIDSVYVYIGYIERQRERDWGDRTTELAHRSTQMATPLFGSSP